jgi:hypothetical protein
LDKDIVIRQGINYNDKVLAQCVELFITQEPIEPETITLAEAMERALHQTIDYNLTPLDHEPMEIFSTSVISTALTLPTKAF